MKPTDEETSKKNSAIQEIIYRLETMGQPIHSEQMPTLNETPLPELEQLLEALRTGFNDGAQAKKFCIDTIYASQNRRREAGA